MRVEVFIACDERASIGINAYGVVATVGRFCAFARQRRIEIPVLGLEIGVERG